ncbi:hypothetical protein [Silvibacterium acidisoli]|uniref:hypothetical protein n=1 Tax=Acidobacteriaceae bacterium ZG23-2 TaxID=2883246 RepID=UPI00406BE3C9
MTMKLSWMGHPGNLMFSLSTAISMLYFHVGELQWPKCNMESQHMTDGQEQLILRLRPRWTDAMAGFTNFSKVQVKKDGNYADAFRPAQWVSTLRSQMVAVTKQRIQANTSPLFLRRSNYD